MPGRKRIHLVLGEDGHLQVRAPHPFTRSEAESVIYSRSIWVLDALRRNQVLRAERPLLGTGTRLSLLDEDLRLIVIQRPKPFVIREEDILRVYVPSITEQDIKSSLERWYRNQAKDYLPARLVDLAEHVGAYPARVSIRSQKTRWGSCSGKGHISLNWRLMLLPIRLADYVLIHELCHLHYLDHSPRFWALVKRLIPDCKERRARLVKVQRRLML